MADVTDEITPENWHCFNVTTLEAIPSSTGQTFLISLYSTTALLALLGNVTVIIVASVGKQSALTIRLNLINLAVSDIMLGVLCVPFTYTDFMWGRWAFPHWLCPAVQFVQLLSVSVTSMTLTLIGVERYTATLHPFSSLHRWLSSHTGILLPLTWILSALYACIPLVHTTTIEFEFDNHTYYECTYAHEWDRMQRDLFMWTNFGLTFLLPLLVLIFSYSSIMRKLINDRQEQRSVVAFISGSGSSRDDMPKVLRRSTPSNHRVKTINMLFTVILLYALCWAPIKLYQFLIDQGILRYCSKWSLDLIAYAYFACHWIAMSSSFINPILYSFRSDSFRKDFRRICKAARQSFTRR